MNVVTRSEAERFLDLPSGSADALLDRLITDVSAMLATATGRRGWDQAERTEYHDGGRSFILPYYFPIVSVELWDDSDYEWDSDTLVDSTDYRADQYGIIWATFNFSDAPDAVKITYTAGYANEAAIPDIIKAAALRQIEAEYNMRRRTGGQRDMQTGVVLPEVADMLVDYTRRMRFA